MASYEQTNIDIGLPQLTVLSFHKFLPVRECANGKYENNFTRSMADIRHRCGNEWFVANTWIAKCVVIFFSRADASNNAFTHFSTALQSPTRPTSPFSKNISFRLCSFCHYIVGRMAMVVEEYGGEGGFREWMLWIIALFRLGGALRVIRFIPSKSKKKIGLKTFFVLLCWVRIPKFLFSTFRCEEEFQLSFFFCKMTRCKCVRPEILMKRSKFKSILFPFEHTVSTL